MVAELRAVKGALRRFEHADGFAAGLDRELREQLAIIRTGAREQIVEGEIVAAQRHGLPGLHRKNALGAVIGFGGNAEQAYADPEMRDRRADRRARQARQSGATTRKAAAGTAAIRSARSVSAPAIAKNAIPIRNGASTGPPCAIAKVAAIAISAIAKAAIRRCAAP